MYGGVEKTAEQKAADQTFIDAVMKIDGDRKIGAEHLVQKGWQSFADGDSDTAMKRFNQAWLLDTQNADAFWGFGSIRASQGKTEEGIAFLKQGLAINPRHVLLLCNLGMLTVRNMSEKGTGSFDEAVTYFQHAQSIDSHQAQCHANWAVAYFFHGDFADAWGQLHEAQKIDPKSVNESFLRDLSAKMSEPK